MGFSKTSDSRATARPSTSTLRSLHELFVAGQVDASYLDTTSLRPVVAESWQRSLATGVDPDSGGAQPAVSVALERMRASHPLAPALPLIRRLLVDDATDAGVVVAVSAADGTLLWVEGDRNACRKAERMNFVPGADWSERGAGTNAPGTALALDAELQIRGTEHFSRIVQPWSCTAVPVHDPATGALIGAIDLTGGTQVASRQTLALVRATAVAVENHLGLLRLGQPAVAESTTARLTVLGADRPRWQMTDDGGQPQTSTLTGRHADILVLLSRHPEGLSADHLAMLLDDKDLDVVTIRAEMSRLRRVIGAEYIASRPYRLLSPIASDVGDVFDALQAGDVDSALIPLHRRAASAVGVTWNRAAAHGAQCVRARRCAVVGKPCAASPLARPAGGPRRPGLLAGAVQPRCSGSVMRAHARGHLAGLDLDLA